MRAACVTSRRRIGAQPQTGHDRSREYLVLTLITLVGAALRFYRLDTDLWIDEIGSFEYAMEASLVELVRTFHSPNHHLLNALLERASVAAFREHDWSVRLPAAVFGIATIPAMHWLARPLMGRWQSLSVAFLTAVSYHHVWFSQNARGYTGYLLFSVLATGALWRLIHATRRRWIVIYVVSAILSLTSLVIAAFMMIAHVLLAAALLLVRRHRREPVATLARALGLAFGLTFVASLAIYGPMAAELLRNVGSAYVREGTGFQPVSLEFVTETLKGLAAGFGSLALVGAIPFLALVVVGTVSLMRRAWLVVLSFIIPLCLMAALVVAAGWLTSPRFFILVVPLAFLVAVETLDLVARRLSQLAAIEHSRRRIYGVLATMAVAACAVALALGLPRYYAVPKQSFQAAIASFARRAGPGDALVAVYQADRGFQYYTRRLGLDRENRYFATRTTGGLDSLGAQLAGRRVWVATTFERAFKLEDPALWKRVEDGWSRVEWFPATVGYGEITLWQPRQ